MRRQIIRIVARSNAADTDAYLTQIALDEKSAIEDRAYAAEHLIFRNQGRIDNSTLLSVFVRGFRTPQPGDYYPRDKAVRLVAKNARDAGIRRDALRNLTEWKILRLDPSNSVDYTEIW